MILATVQPAVNNIIPLLSLISTITVAVIAAVWVIIQLVTKNKDKAQDKDLVILKQEFDAKINKERGSREKKELEIFNQLVSQGKDIIALVNKIDDNQEKGFERWNEFTRYQQQWADGISESKGIILFTAGCTVANIIISY